MSKPEVKRYRVEGPNGATVVVRVGGPRGMSERNWKLRLKNGELKVIDELDEHGLPVKAASKRGKSE